MILILMALGLVMAFGFGYILEMLAGLSGDPFFSSVASGSERLGAPELSVV